MNLHSLIPSILLYCSSFPYWVLIEPPLPSTISPSTKNFPFVSYTIPITTLTAISNTKPSLQKLIHFLQTISITPTSQGPNPTIPTITNHVLPRNYRIIARQCICSFTFAGILMRGKTRLHLTKHLRRPGSTHSIFNELQFHLGGFLGLQGRSCFMRSLRIHIASTDYYHIWCGATGSGRLFLK